MGHYGLIALRPGINFEQERRKAWLRYRNECLKVRSSYVEAHKYDMKMRGVELKDEPKWERWKRHERELTMKLELHEPIEQEYSYLTEVEMEKLGLDKGKLKTLEDEGKLKKNLFDGLVSQKFEVVQTDNQYVELKEVRTEPEVLFELPKQEVEAPKPQAKKK